MNDCYQDLVLAAAPRLQDAGWPRRVALLSVHTSPLAPLGSRDAGGMNVYVRELATALGARGVAVDVFTRRSDPDTSEVEHAAPGFRVISVDAGAAAAVDRETLFGLVGRVAAGIEAFRGREGVEYDVLHSHYWLSGLVAERLARLWRGVPWAHMSHTLAVLKDAHRAPGQPRETAQRVRAETRVLAEADGVIAANEVERDELRRRYGLDPLTVSVAPCGVDLALFSPGDRHAARRETGIGAEDRAVLYVGRIEPLKGLDTLLDAAALLARRVPRLRVLVVGGSRGGGDAATETELTRLRERAASLGVERVVEFHGPAPQRSLPPLYRAADVAVVPSRYESFGMAALEALACGTPVVASRVGGLQTTVRDGENGLLFPVGDAAALAAALERVLGVPATRAAMAARAVETAQRYGWDRVADANLAAYHNLRAPEREAVLVDAELPLSA